MSLALFVGLMQLVTGLAIPLGSILHRFDPDQDQSVRLCLFEVKEAHLVIEL